MLRLDLRGAGSATSSLRLLFAGLFLVACGGSSEGTPDGSVGTRRFAEPCETLDDCVSGLCLATGASTAVCTELCETDADCPNGASFGCISAEGFGPRVCGCAVDAEEEICGDGRDNDCNGRTDDCRICDGRYVAQDDPEHCGACGVSCGAGNICLDGECVCSGAGDERCDGACVDVSSSPFHCGGCGNLCEGRECIDGACGCPDARPEFCADRGCVDFDTDPRHCGACGNACPTGQTCRGGECACPADGGQTYCGSQCIDVRSNTANCGSCGNACPTGISCVGGECDCGLGQEVCGSSCTNVSVDPANCGACGTRCRLDQTCTGGRCGCAPGQTECGGVCIDTTFDSLNCGGCGVVCPTGASCNSGVCQCGARERVCGGRCLDTNFDVTNCGTCGNTCATGEVCSFGSCNCSSGVYCGTTCMPANDRANCGACGNVCGASQSCTSGSCRCSISGTTACGTECFDLRTDEANCGTCGTVCRAGETCTSGRCACPSGQTWCATTGTCVSLSTDEANCGGCGVTCRDTEQCISGSCRCPFSNQAWCDGACIDVYSNPSNCGACGNVCAADSVCSVRSCRCSISGQTSCGADGCRDLQTDLQHCGSCGNACAGGQYCASGNCLCPVATPGSPIEAGTSFGPIVWDSVWDGTRLASAQIEEGSSVEISWIDATGAAGSRLVATGIESPADLWRVRITPSAMGWNVLIQAAPFDTGVVGHYLVRVASDGSVIGTRQLDSSIAAWAHADLTYVPGTGPVLTWITGSPATAFARVLAEDGTNLGSPVVLGNVTGVPAIAWDGTSELAVSVANTTTGRLRTYFLSSTLTLLATRDDTGAVATNERPFLQGRAGQWLVLARSTTTSTRVVTGARLETGATRSLAYPRSVHWVGDEATVLSGGAVPFSSAVTPTLFRRFEATSTLTPIDAALTLSSFEVALGVARVSPTRALVLGGDADRFGTYGAVLDLGDCPR
ncbi:MAG: hypothetical protein R3B99_10495 [Polyangiales bacterium]